MTRKKGAEGPTVDSIFPIDDPLEEVTLGYPDFSGGIITRELQSMQPDELIIVQRYAELRRVGFIAHVDYLSDLLDGFHNVDPERRSKGGVDLVEAEIEGSREHFKILENRRFIPIIADTESPDDFSDDAGDMGWVVYPTDADQIIWFEEHPDVLDIISAYLKDPETAEAYNEEIAKIKERIQGLFPPLAAFAIFNSGDATDPID